MLRLKSFALIPLITCLSACSSSTKLSSEQSKQAFDDVVYTTDYCNHAIEYADAYHFVHSRLFVIMCAFVDLDPLLLRSRLSEYIDHWLS